MQIAANKVVSIEYTLKDTDGKVLDTSDGGEPLLYLHGASNIVPGLEKALEGKSEGDSVEVTVQPEEGYGTRDDNAIRKMPARKLSADKRVAVGQRYRAMTPEGPRIVTVLSVAGDYCTVDANHPLAGIVLNFAVKVVGIRDASEEEVAHGHVHTPGSHQH
ncbi:MAG: peptidylprolyl isomerase [Deltaproteobacteria bacterium]|nr:peptidylprolyl isomerase [Deltaproteobacteria bacterium]